MDPFFKSGSDRLACVKEKPSNCQNGSDFGLWILDSGFWISDFLACGVKKVAIMDFGFWISDFGSGCRFCMVAKIYDRLCICKKFKGYCSNTTYVARNGVLVRTPS